MQSRKTFTSIAFVFIILNGIFFFTRSFLKDNGFDLDFLFCANLLLFFISLGAIFLQTRTLQSANPQAFVRGVYSSMIFKMFICMIAVLIYVFLLRNKINKPGLFTAMGMYIIYTVVEVAALMKIARKKTNA